MKDDAELLRLFADEGSQAAFAELVQRKINLIYAAALRQVGNDAHLAQDVTQGVFLALASRASALQHHAALTGWLHTTTRFIATKTVRTHRRWQQREEEANAMKNPTGTSEPAWEQLRPVIDQSLHELSERDREAILLRFFEGRSLAEVATAVGLAENSARMRVERALEKLRGKLARRGITSTTAALGLVLAAQPAVAVPAGLATSAAGLAFAGSAAAGSGAMAAAWAWHFMSTTKILIGVASVCAAVGIGAYFSAHSQNGSASASARTGPATPEAALAAAHAESERLKAELARLRSSVGATPAVAEKMPAVSADQARLVAALTRLRVLMELRQNQLAKPEMAEFVAQGAQLTQAFTDLFALTSGEQETLQRSINDARERLTALERENATVSRDAIGNVVIAVKSFPAAGGAVYDATFKTFAETLGPERFAAFTAFGAEQIERALGRFGLPERRIIFTRNPDTSSDTRYIMREDLQLMKERGHYSTDFKTVEEMRLQGGTIIDLLPTDFTAAP